MQRLTRAVPAGVDARQIRRHPPVNGDERAFGFQPRQQRVRRYGRAEDEDAVVAVFARIRHQHQLIFFVPDGLRLALAQAVWRIFRLRVLRQQVVIHLGCQSGEKFRFFHAARPCRQHRHFFAAVEHAVACAAPAHAAPQQVLFARQQLWTRRAHRQHNRAAFDDVVADQCHVDVAAWHNLPRQLLNDDNAHLRRLRPEA